jgi:UDPglucose--hexose-1-phosphate uridylyltransferase
LPELRYNVITREWVIIAAERAKRPDDFIRKDKAKKDLPAFSPHCPFCPGNESMTPPETYTLKDGAGWRVRVAPNKFPALSFVGQRRNTIKGISRVVTGVGIHEVIVETPDHSKTLATLQDREVEGVVETYLNRFVAASADPRVEQVTIFKNHGETAGTSLEHPHSQLIATPVITVQVRERLITSLRHFDEYLECIFCHMLELELKDQLRVVLEGEHFVSFVQFATYTPYSMLVMPRRHMACFGEITDAEAADFAFILRRSLGRLYHGLGNPDYNFVIRTAPCEYARVKYYHWYLSIIPRLTKMAGFEMGSGMFINSSLPENDARFLREVKSD